MQENVILGEYQSSEDEGSRDSYFFLLSIWLWNA